MAVLSGIKRYLAVASELEIRNPEPEIRTPMNRERAKLETRTPMADFPGCTAFRQYRQIPSDRRI